MQIQLQSRAQNFEDYGACSSGVAAGPPPRPDLDALYEAQAQTVSPNLSRVASNLLPATIQQEFAQELGQLAADKDQFHGLMASAFGPNYDRTAAEQLRQRALAGDTSWLPRIRFVGNETLQGAHGAYDAKTATVLLNQNNRGNLKLLVQTFAEETGHHLDTLLNAKDSRGDEGEAFRRVLFGEKLSQSQWADIRSENDSGTIQLDGKSVTVEFWNPFSEIAAGISNAASWVSDQVSSVTQGVAEAAVNAGNWVSGAAATVLDAGNSAIRWAGDTLTAAWDWSLGGLTEAWEWSKKAASDAWNWTRKASESTWNFVKDEGERIWDAAKTIGKGVLNGAIGAVKNVGELLGQFGKGLGRVVSGDSEGWKNMGLALAKIPQTVVDAGIMVGGSVVSAVQTIGHLEPKGRSLTDAELSQLRPIFGDSIDYDSVVIKEGDSGILTVSGRAFVLGNTIYLPPKDANDISVLAHEMTHVWQHQNGGTDYASEALVARYMSAENEHEAYTWQNSVPATPWSELNPEQQGAFIQSAMTNEAFAHQPPQFVRVPPGFSGTLTDLNRYLDTALAQINAGLGAP